MAVTLSITFEVASSPTPPTLWPMSGGFAGSGGSFAFLGVASPAGVLAAFSGAGTAYADTLPIRTQWQAAASFLAAGQTAATAIDYSFLTQAYAGSGAVSSAAFSFLAASPCFAGAGTTNVVVTGGGPHNWFVSASLQGQGSAASSTAALAALSAAFAGAGTVALTTIATGYAAAAFAGAGGAAVVVTGGTAIALMTLVNTGPTPSSPGTPTPHFGWVFKEGDFPAGTAPVFQVNGVTQPYSAGLQTYWPDGSLKAATFMLRPTLAIAANSSQVVSLLRGGSWPYTPAQYASPTTTVSGRSLSEVWNQNLILNAPVASGRSNNLASWLYSGDPNQWEVRKWLDGVAGTGWKISTNMSQTKGGAIDGMMVCTHYIIALNDGNGNLGGFRWIGTIRQPYATQTGQAHNAPGGYVWFIPPTGVAGVGLNFSIQPGGTGPVTYTGLPWAGTDGNIFAPVSFSTNGDGSNNCTVSGGYNWAIDGYGFWGSAGTFAPVVFSNLSGSGGNNNPGWGASFSNGGGAFVCTSSSTAFAVLADWANGVGINFSAVATGTATPCPVSMPFQKLMFVNPQATYFFFQGSGSLAAESPLMMQIDRTYWQGSRVIPPYNLTMASVPNGGIITELDWPYTWSPHASGNGMTMNQQNVGDHPDIGLVPAIFSNHFYCQTAGTLYNVRVNGWSGAYARADMLDFTTKKRYNCGDPSKTTAYGLASTPNAPSNGNSAISYNVVNPANTNGIPNPYTGGGTYQYGTGTFSHEPYYEGAYLFDGGMPMLDMVEDHFWLSTLGDGTPIGTGQYGYNAGITPTLWNGCYPGGELRTTAWQMKNMVWAAVFYPYDASGNANNPLYSDGTHLAQFIQDSKEACMTWPLLQFQQVPPDFTASNTYPSSRGVWFRYIAYFVDQSYTGAGWTINAPSEMYEYFAMVYCLAAAHGSANASAFLQTCIITEFANSLSLIGGLTLYGDEPRLFYINTSPSGTGGVALPGGWVTADNQHCLNSPMGNTLDNADATITWGPNYSGSTYTGPAFTINVGNTNTVGPSGLIRPQNGDVIMNSYFDPGATNGWYNVLVPELTQHKSYVFINCSQSGNNYLFDLSNISTGTFNTPDGNGPIHINSNYTQGVDGSGHNPPYNTFNNANLRMGNRYLPVYKAPYHQIGSGGDYFISLGWAWIAWAAALGLNVGSTGNPATLLGDIYNRLTNISGDWGFQFQNQGTFPDSRYCMQPSFA